MAHHPGHRDLKQLFFAGSEPTKRNGQSIGARHSFPAHVTIEQGEEVFEYSKLFFDPAVLETAVRQGNIQLPRNFWIGFYRTVVKRKPSVAGTKMYKTTFQFYLRPLKIGAVTVTGTMGALNRNQRRHYGGEFNALKCPELGQLLYCFLIDCVQSLRCRVDGTFLMRHAQFLKQRLLENGSEPTDLPKLEGASWKSWFQRWRHRFDVRFMKAVKHLKKYLGQRLRKESAFIL